MNQPAQPGQPNQDALEVDDLDPQEPKDLKQQWYEQYAEMSYADLARRMVELKKEASEAETTMKARKAEFEVISQRVVPERMLKDEQTSIRLKGIGRLGISLDAWCTVIPGRKEDLISFLKQDPELAELVKEDINPSTLKSLVKGMAAEATEQVGEVDLEAALEGAEPEQTEFDKIQQFVNFTPFYKASVTKG